MCQNEQCQLYLTVRAAVWARAGVRRSLPARPAFSSSRRPSAAAPFAVFHSAPSAELLSRPPVGSADCAGRRPRGRLAAANAPLPHSADARRRGGGGGVRAHGGIPIRWRTAQAKFAARRGESSHTSQSHITVTHPQSHIPSHTSQSHIPSHTSQSHIPSHQSPVTHSQSPIPSHQSPVTHHSHTSQSHITVTHHSHTSTRVLPMTIRRLHITALNFPGIGRKCVRLCDRTCAERTTNCCRSCSACVSWPTSKRGSIRSGDISHLTPLTSHLTPLISHLTPLISHLTSHTSLLTPLISHHHCTPVSRRWLITSSNRHINLSLFLSRRSVSLAL